MQQDVRDYLLSKPEAREDYPFDNVTPVYKVQDKMFALLTRKEGVERINLKCDPEHALMLRDLFPAVTAGYHMNKRHWNTVVLDGSLPQGEIERLIDHSYYLVVKGLKKATRQGMEMRHGQAALYRGALGE